MPEHIKNRKRVIDSLREELVGPSPQGQEIDCTGAIVLDEMAQYYGPWRQKGSGEEILFRDAPLKRYGIGVLYPIGSSVEDDSEDQGILMPGIGVPTEQDGAVAESVLASAAEHTIDDIQERTQRTFEADADDFDISSANRYRPSTMGISFLVDLKGSSKIFVEASGGRYIRKEVTVKAKQDAGEGSGRKEFARIWWLRSSVVIRASFDGTSVRRAHASKVKEAELETQNTEGLSVAVELFARKFAGDLILLTVCLVNRATVRKPDNQLCLFQSHFKVSVKSSDGTRRILPYPGPPAEKLDPEEQSLALLYRNAQTYAVGHGCAADWGSRDSNASVEWVSGECLPQCEVPSITSEVTRADRTVLNVSMALLAGLIKDQDGFSALKDVIESYEAWIKDRRNEASRLDARYKLAAEKNLDQCSRCAQRMRAGLDYLQTDKQAQRAFQLANHAMLQQQLRARRGVRSIQFDEKSKRFSFNDPHPEPDLTNIPADRGSWFAFQIAFLLMSVRSAAQGHAPDRRTVELIWFPTGGGKTEAYLGLAAFTMFLRRLRNKDDSGVHVLTRYTLRLLTAQQFLRASGLICAMEALRKDKTSELGDHEFSIGMWLGGATTPNTRAEARSVLTGLSKGDRYTENQFVLDRCPWCSAQIGPIDYGQKPPKGAPFVEGYERRGDTVVLRCSDVRCRFNRDLPVYVIDEDIYEKRPTLVIGTIDKFAMLAWKPQARAIFGLDEDGIRASSPPGLIIQDELHLISGPLGSISGLYETLIEELCTDRRDSPPAPPKIVSSTATIRRYEDQIQALYGRNDVALFPPPGLDAGDSFFARYARDDGGNLLPGRVYLGIHGPGFGSVQTAEVRTFAALLQAPVPLSEEARDPWWTLLLFFNSLRELGNTLSLFQSDIPDRFKVLRNRLGVDWKDLRRLGNIKELTGRLRSDEVPKAIAALEVPYGGEGRPVDVCLASNIIEVGIDIDRLSLMSVVGQPKTTSQYIQVTGRVGRKWRERPGVVATIYSPSKPRDRSHFEKFRSYHERLYSQVEPTSVTPFSPPTLDRALHAIMSAQARLTGGPQIAESPYPFPASLLEKLRQIVSERVSFVDPGEKENCDRLFSRRMSEWKRWEPSRWNADWQSSDSPLLREAGGYVPREWDQLSWPTPTSMRNVDAECEAVITTLYLRDPDQNDAKS